jgi:hypothetical protein
MTVSYVLVGVFYSAHSHADGVAQKSWNIFDSSSHKVWYWLAKDDKLRIIKAYQEI